MRDVIDLEAWREILVRTASELGGNLASFLPKLLGACLILGLGYLLSRSVEAIAGRGLRRLGLDRAAARLRVGELLERAEIERSASQILARLLFWLVLLTFVLSSVEALGLTAVTSTIDRLIAFLPGVIAAALLAIAGLFAARLAGSAVRSAASAAGLAGSARIGFATQALLAGVVFVVCVEQLGVQTEVLVVPFAVSVGAIGFAAGLAFALGARPLITHILAGHFLKQSLPRDAAVEIAGRRGVVELIGPVCTVLRNGDGSWSIPNAQLLDQIVVR
jgi:hypothetical protein